MKIVFFIITIKIFLYGFPNNEWVFLNKTESENLGWNLNYLKKAEEYKVISNTEAVMIIQQGKIIKHWGNINKKYF
jgi:hypothetical protein